MAIVSGDDILVKPKDLDARLYRYELGAIRRVEVVNDADKASAMQHKLDAFLQTATDSLLNNTTGVTPALQIPSSK